MPNRNWNRLKAVRLKRLGSQGFGASLKSQFSFPIGQAIPDGYTAADSTLPYLKAQKQFDYVVLENRMKPNRLYTITNSGVLQAERVFSATTANTDIAASFAPVQRFHTLSDPTREPTGLTVSSTPGATNYWKDVLTQRVTDCNGGVTGFATIPEVEIANELLDPAQTGGYAVSIFKTAAAGDGTWSLDPALGAPVVLYDALVALGGSRRYVVNENQLDDAGRGIGTSAIIDSASMSRPKKRARMIDFWQKFLAARQPAQKPLQGFQFHLGTKPYYLNEFLFYLDELSMLRVGASITELNTVYSTAAAVWPQLTTTQMKRDYIAQLAAFAVKQVGQRIGINSLMGWTASGAESTIMESGVLSEIGNQLLAQLSSLGNPTLPKRALRNANLGTLAEVQDLPWIAGVTNVLGFGVYGTAGAMSQDVTKLKERTADNASPTAADTTNMSRVHYHYISTATVGAVLFQEKDGSAVTFNSAQIIAGPNLQVTLNGTNFDLGPVTAGELVKIVIDHNGTTLKACLGRYKPTTNVAAFSAVSTKTGAAATQVASITYPNTAGDVRLLATEWYYAGSRLASDADMLAAAEAYPEQPVNPNRFAGITGPTLVGASTDLATAIGTWATGVAETVDVTTIFGPHPFGKRQVYSANIGSFASDGKTWSYTPTDNDWVLYGDPGSFDLIITATDSDGNTITAEYLQQPITRSAAPPTLPAPRTVLFNVLEGQAPVLTANSPADDATGVALNVKPTYTLDRPVVFDTSGSAGVRLVKLRNVTDGSDAATFDATTDVGTTSGKMQLLSSTSLQLWPASSLLNSKSYAFRLSGGPLTNLGGIPIADISSDTLANFTTVAAASEPTRVGYKDGNGLSADFTIDISTGLSAMVSGDTPGTAAPGDWILVVMGQVTSNVNIVEAVSDNQGLTWTALGESYADDSNDANLGVFWAQIGATVPTQITVKGSGSSVNGAYARVFVYRDLNPTTPFVASSPANTTNSGLGDAPSTTPAKVNDNIWAFAVIAQSAAPSITSYTIGNMTLTPGLGEKLGSTRSVHLISAYLKATSTSLFNPDAFGVGGGTDANTHSAIAITVRAQAA